MNMCFINSNDTLITLFTSKTKEKEYAQKLRQFMR